MGRGAPVIMEIASPLEREWGVSFPAVMGELLTILKIDVFSSVSPKAYPSNLDWAKGGES